MNTFIHLGDAHLHPGPRNDDRRRAIDQIIGECSAIPTLAAWLWPGDLFHSRSTIDDRNWLASRIQAMAQRAPVVICYGNHDLPGDLSIFSQLAAAWPIHVVDSPCVLRLRLATGVMSSIAILPYPTRAGLLGAGTPSPSVTDAAREALEAIFRGFVDQLEMARAMGDVTAFIGHVNVAGAVTSVGQPNIGREIEIDAALLALLGNCYKGLNHIHKGQVVDGAFYAGSICRMDYGEIEPKHYQRVEIANDGAFETWPCELRVAPMYHVEGRLTRTGFEYQVIAGPGGAVVDPPLSWAGADVRVRYYMKRSERSALNEKLVIEVFRDALRLQLDPVIENDREIRSREVAEARSLHDKLIALVTMGGGTVTDGLPEKLAALEHQPATMVLTAVQALIAPLEHIEMASPSAEPATLEEAWF